MACPRRPDRSSLQEPKIIAIRKSAKTRNDRSKRRNPLIFLLLALAYLSGCAPANIPATPAFRSTSSPTPQPTATLTPAGCTATQGQVLHLQIPSTLLPGPLAFNLYLPPCYSDHPDRPYPVLYLLHGQGFEDDQWVRLGATRTADQLIFSGQSRSFLIVMPEEENSTLADPNISHFGDALTGELVPWIDAHYPTCSQRSCRAIGGLSRGAAWAVRLGLTHPDLFGAIGAHSLPLFVGDLYRASTWLDDIPAGQMPQFYLDIGRSDRYLSQAESFEQLLSDRHIAHTWQLNDGDHDEVYWNAHTPEYIQWYASNWGK